MNPLVQLENTKRLLTLENGRGRRDSGRDIDVEGKRIRVEREWSRWNGRKRQGYDKPPEN